MHFFCTYLQGFELGLSDQRKNIAVVCHWLALGWLLYLQLNKRLLLPRVTLWCNWQTILQIWTIIWTNEDHITSFMLLYITIYPFVTKLWKREMMYWRVVFPTDGVQLQTSLEVWTWLWYLQTFNPAPYLQKCSPWTFTFFLVEEEVKSSNRRPSFSISCLFVAQMRNPFESDDNTFPKNGLSVKLPGTERGENHSKFPLKYRSGNIKTIILE